VAEERLTIAMPRTAGRSPRTAWVCVPVQKNAREKPCRKWATTNGTTAVLRAASPQESASMAVAAMTKVQSAKRFIQEPMPIRPSIWVTALSATRTPTWTPVYPASRARRGRATDAAPREVE
jgi:hypothetical protein